MRGPKTGKYSHINGVYKFTALDQSQPTLPKLMREAAYHTGFIGKYHLHSNPVGLDYWSILPGQGRYHNPPTLFDDYATRSNASVGRQNTCPAGHAGP